MSAKTLLFKFSPHVLALLPLIYLGWLISTNNLGTDPAQHLVHELGFWALVWLWASLAITPLRLMLKQPQWMLMRRPLGLWSFTYVCLHLLVFVLAWCGLDPGVIREEILERPYILLGLLAWLLLIPLAVTSTQSLRRRMGRRWLKLHRLVYVIAVLAFIHLALAAKLEYVKPVVFGILLIFLFFIRVRARQARTAPIKCAPSA